jgi:hypothetical protein
MSSSTKRLGVLGHAELFELIYNLLHGGHHPSRPERGQNLGDESLHRCVRRSTPPITAIFAVLAPSISRFAWNLNLSGSLRIRRDSPIKINVVHHFGAGDRLTWLSEPRHAGQKFLTTASPSRLSSPGGCVWLTLCRPRIGAQGRRAPPFVESCPCLCALLKSREVKSGACVGEGVAPPT